MTQLFTNNATSVLSTPLTTSGTSLTVIDGSAFPAPTGGQFFLVTLAGLDSNGNENAWEVVKVTLRSGNTLTVVRGQEGTVARAWPSATLVEARLTAGSLDSKLDAGATAVAATKLATARTINGVAFDGTANITVADSTKEPAFAAGTASQYRRGDKTWQDLPSAVRATALTGMTTSTSTAITAADTLVNAAGKLQGQITGLGTSKLDATANAVSASKLATPRTVSLTGDVTGTVSFDGSADVAITATVADDSHNHTVANVDGLQTALDGKLAAAGTAVAASKLATARTLSLTGDVTGSASFDGSANVTITATVADDSHNHTVANVDGLQTALDGKFPLAGGTATGTINAPTFNATSTTNGGFQGIDADTALLPSFTWTGDLNTGMWRADVDAIGFTCGGVNRITINTTGISGNGSQLTALNASNISSGTIAAARVPTLNQSTTGNAATATALQTGRTIGMTGDVTWTSASFNGSANVTGTATLANSGATAGTYRSVTVDAKGRVTAGTNPTTLAGYGISDAQIAARTSATFTTTAGGWYRIATSASGISRNSGEFVVDWSVGGNHGAVRFAAGCHYGQTAGVSLMQENFSAYNVATGIVEARIVYHETYSGNFAYVEVKFGSALTNVVVGVEVQDSIGWSLVTPSTAGSVPAGYKAYNHVFVPSAAITAGTYPKVTINQEGRVISGSALVASDIPSLDASKIGSGTLADARLPSTMAGKTFTGGVVIESADQLRLKAGPGTTGYGVIHRHDGSHYYMLVTASGDAGGAWTTARPFMLNLSTGVLDINGNAATATKLQTPRTINNVAFDGTANITVADSTKLPLTGGTLDGKLTVPAPVTASASLTLPHGTTPTTLTNGDMWTTTSGLYVRINGVTRDLYHSGNLADVSQTEAEAGTATSRRAWTALRVRQAVGAANAASATKLQTPRTINGVPFDGTADIAVSADPNLAVLHANALLF